MAGTVIKALTSDHLDECKALANRMHRESGYSARGALNPGRAAHLIMHLLLAPETLVYRRGMFDLESGQMVGLFVGQLVMDTWCDFVRAEDVIFYAMAPRRADINVMRLVQGYQEWATGTAEMDTELGPLRPVEIRIGVMFGGPDENKAVAKFVQALGYKRSGYLMSKGV